VWNANRPIGQCTDAIVGGRRPNQGPAVNYNKTTPATLVEVAVEQTATQHANNRDKALGPLLGLLVSAGDNEQERILPGTLMRFRLRFINKKLNFR
jgi:hypothetical protein